MKDFDHNKEMVGSFFMILVVALMIILAARQLPSKNSHELKNRVAVKVVINGHPYVDFEIGGKR